jgi:hypothetical protein
MSELAVDYRMLLSCARQPTWVSLLDPRWLCRPPVVCLSWPSNALCAICKRRITMSNRLSGTHFFYTSFVLFVCLFVCLIDLLFVCFMQYILTIRVFYPCDIFMDMVLKSLESSQHAKQLIWSRLQMNSKVYYVNMIGSLATTLMFFHGEYGYITIYCICYVIVSIV